jgi:fibronectin type 3 domain-containing protein
VTPTSSNTPSQTPSSTNTPSNTASSTATASQTASQTATPSQTPSSTNIPSVPTGLSVGTVTSTSVNLSWNSSSGASSYKIYRSSNSVGGPYTFVVSASSTSYAVNTSSIQGSVYYYVVTAVNASGESAYSANQVGAISLAGTQGLTLNSAITNAAGTSQTLSFSWTGVTGSNSYTLYQSTTSGQELISGTAVCTTSSTSCNVSTTLGSSYYYVLVASNSTVSSNTVASSEVTMPNVTSVNPTLTAVSSTQAILDFVPTANLQAPYSVYYYTSSFNGGNATTTGGATLACSYNSSPSSTPAVSPTPTSTATGTGTSTKNITPSGTASQSPTSSSTPSSTVNAGSYSCPVIDTSDQMLYFVVVGTLANGASYQSEEASVPLIGNFSITNIVPAGYSATYGNRTIQINFPMTSVGGTTYTVSYKQATDVNYISVPGSFTSSPITLDFSVNGLNLFPNAMYMFQVTATNSTGTKSNSVSVTSNAPWYYKTPNSLGTSSGTSYYVNSIGNIYGWGISTWYTLLSAPSNQNSPYQLTTTNDAVTISAGLLAGGWAATCMVSSSLQPKCVGYNISGQVGQPKLGQPDYATYSTFSKVYTYASVPSPSNTSLLTPSATPVGTLSSSPSGLPTVFVSNIINVRVSLVSTVALDSSQKFWGWGANGNGQLQDPDTSTQYWAVQGSEGRNYLAVGLGALHACGLVTDHTIRCWGGSSSGQAGNFNGTNVTSTVITDAASNTITDFMDIAVGYYHTCAIRSDGSIWCWGGSYGGNLGSSSGNTAVAVPATTFTTNDAVSLVAGNYYTCVLRKNGQVWCWGLNNYGQIGQNPLNVSSSSTAYQIPNLSDVRTIATGSDSSAHLCALSQNVSLQESIWCWGSNTYGELGAGNSPTPGFTPSVTPSMTNSGTSASTVTPSASPAGGVTPSSTPSNTPSNSPSNSPMGNNYQYTPQYVSVPVM